MTKKTLSATSPNRILIRSTNWIGDAIMTTPAIRTIRENFPQAHISILVNPWVADVFTASPHIDEIILYEKKGAHAGISGIWRLARELASRHFDMAILLQNAFEAALIARLAGIPIRAGYKRDARGPLLNHGIAINRTITHDHQIYYYQALLKELGLACGKDELFLEIPTTQHLWAREALAPYGNSGPIIGLNPGAAYGPAKRWPAERYGELAALLQKKLNALIVVFGTKADHEAQETIKKMTGANLLALAGRTSLAEAIAMIAHCNCFITNDSGLMHVAAALKTALVAIFGSTNHITTGPFSANSVVVRKEMPCSPCLKSHCSTDFRCMNSIEPEEIYQTVHRLI